MNEEKVAVAKILRRLVVGIAIPIFKSVVHCLKYTIANAIKIVSVTS